MVGRAAIRRWEIPGSNLSIALLAGHADTLSVPQVRAHTNSQGARHGVLRQLAEHTCA